MSALDWPLDADGYPHREAARVLLFDDAGRVLLAMGHDEDQPDRAWWFTIGGGIEEGEDPRAAAVREVFEETGLRLDAHELVGPVLYRTAEFDFLAVTARQDEWFFIARAPSTNLSRDGWTDLERSVIDAQRWWDIDEAAASIDGEIYPAQILEFARAWKDGWDGHLIELTDTREP
jgi:hydrolase, NUDIX family